MPQVRFEPMIPVFERTKTVHALDGMAAVICKGCKVCEPSKYEKKSNLFWNVINFEGQKRI
jgi:hypothetical protein